MNSNSESRVVKGLAVARGFAVGPVFVYRGTGDIPVPEYVVEAGREGDELLRYRRAVFEAKHKLETLVSALNERSARAEVKIFECHLMLMDDPLLKGDVEKQILENRVNAEAAVRRAIDRARALFGKMDDPYLRERVRDIDDVGRRLLSGLLGDAATPRLELKVPSIIVADELTPSEAIQLPRELVIGFATDSGSTTSHVALLARSMGIPAVAGLGDITSRVNAGEKVLLNGTEGTVTLSPTATEIRDFSDLVEIQKEASEVVSHGPPPGSLRGGGEVLLYANVHPGAPLEGLRTLGARGIGLYRSEYLWLNNEGEPSEDEQYQAYREVAEFAATLSPNATVAIRVLDIGGDKVVKGISQLVESRMREANPFLGARSIRFLLANPQIFRTQLRAILRASAHGKLKILYPMIACAEELRAAKKILIEARQSLDAEGIEYDHNIPIGAMIEVPAAAICAETLARHVDFFSIGTNDLVQYTLAADRGNEAVAYLQQPTHPAVLRLMRQVVDAAKKSGILISVCGESASDPIVGILWAAMGIDALSMSATYIPVISRVLSRLTKQDLEDYRLYVEGIVEETSGPETLELCREWLKGRVPDLENVLV